MVTSCLRLRRSQGAGYGLQSCSNTCSDENTVTVSAVGSECIARLNRRAVRHMMRPSSHRVRITEEKEGRAIVRGLEVGSTALLPDTKSQIIL